MARKNFGVGIGRPPAPPAAKMGTPPRGRSAAPMGASPSDGFKPAIPAAAFKGGGKVGYSCMPRHHDDAKFYPGFNPTKK